MGGRAPGERRQIRSATDSEIATMTRLRSPRGAGAGAGQAAGGGGLRRGERLGRARLSRARRCARGRTSLAPPCVADIEGVHRALAIGLHVRGADQRPPAIAEGAGERLQQAGAVAAGNLHHRGGDREAPLSTTTVARDGEGVCPGRSRRAAPEGGSQGPLAARRRLQARRLQPVAARRASAAPNAPPPASCSRKTSSASPNCGGVDARADHARPRRGERARKVREQAGPVARGDGRLRRVARRAWARRRRRPRPRFAARRDRGGSARRAHRSPRRR